MEDTRIIPVIDLGATHTRRGFVAASVSQGRFTGTPYLLYPEKPKKIKNPTKFVQGHPKGFVTDLTATLEKTVENLKVLYQRVKKKYRYPLVKTVGISAPGAWLEEGIPYKGTVPNVPDLENFNLAEEVSRMMGPGWRAAVNNDGVANVLAMAHYLLANIEKYPAAKEALKESGKIAGFIPGTGFGAGAFYIKESQVMPIPGPQQFFDIIVGEGEGRICPHCLTPEDLATGEGLKHQAERNIILANKFSKEKLTGEFMASLTEHRDESIKEAARALYRKAGEALAQTMILAFEGGAEGESKKAVVNDPPRLETEFWQWVKGTRVFILGGWLTAKPAKRYTLSVLEKTLKNKGYDFVIILADEIPGITELLEKDAAGLIGAALLLPPSAMRILD
jgi:predicted NBD/HSP70 family sugar kinase